MNFIRTKSELIYGGKVFDLYQDTIRYPNGRMARFDLIHHGGAVAIIPVDAEGNIWFVRQFRPAIMEMILEIPAGTIEPGEDPDVCASREIREEIGMAADEMIKIGEMYLAPGYSTEFMHMYLARGLYPDALEQDVDEYIEVEKYSVKEVFEMAQRGEIKDAKTLAALTFVRDHLDM